MAPGATLESSTLETSSVLTPEKLAIMKLNSSLDRDVFSEPGSPRLGARQLNFETSSQAGGAAYGRSMSTRASRQVSSSARRSTSFMSSHRNKMSLELTTQAESKFFSLMEFMSNASREASSLKEYWTRLMSEREAFARERDELLVQIETITESLERSETQHQNHGRELGERKKEVEKLLLELSIALNGVTEYKKKVAERDLELDRVHGELREIKVSSTRAYTDHDKMKGEFDGLESRLRIAEGERDQAREDADKHRSDTRSLTREHTDLKTKHADIISKHDSSRKEISTLLDRIRSFDREREDHHVERDRLQDELRKANLKHEESSRDLTDLTDRHQHLHREHNKTKETIHTVEAERDEHASTIERLRYELKAKTAALESAEANHADVVLKHEKAKREIITHTDRIRDIEHETTDLRRSLDSKTEEHRAIVVERDQGRDDLDDERRKVTDRDHTISGLRESLSRAEASLNEVRLEVTSLNERITTISRERDDVASKHQPFTNEITELKEKIAILQAELRNVTDHRDRARKELHDFKQKYAEITETITEYESGSSELEYEIESLRTLLREAREQKERAIAARQTADRERDEYVAKYEEKCRELEKWEENRASWYREHSHGSGHLHGGSRSTSTRVVTRSSGYGAASSGYAQAETQGESGERVDGE